MSNCAISATPHITKILEAFLMSQLLLPLHLGQKPLHDGWESGGMVGGREGQTMESSTRRWLPPSIGGENGGRGMIGADGND